VADLECGHSQHVRHEPPWQVRPWVQSPEGRAAMIGTALECPFCRDSMLDSEPGGSEAPLEPADLDTWDTEVEVICPYCGEAITIGVDPAGGAVQAYVEDCQVCCRPWQVHLSYDEHGAAHVWLEIA
jgi:Protein of unknown function (DUF3565)/Cysteine-rich CPXCG